MPGPMDNSLAYGTNSDAPSIVGGIVGVFDSIYSAVSGRPVAQVQQQVQTASPPAAGSNLLLLVVVVVGVWFVAKKL